MFADRRRVRARRIKRHLKAAASIAVALAAGTFLACRQDKPPDEPVDEPDVEPAPSPEATSEPSAAPAPAPSTALVPTASTSAMVPAPPPRAAPTVDKREHRKGMPVPDNLLE